METKPQQTAGKPDAKEVAEGKGMAILAYIIALIPYFAGDKKNKFVRFHAIQGMNLLIISVGISIVCGIISGIISGIMLSDCSSLSAWLYRGGGSCNYGTVGLISFIVFVPAIIVGIIDLIGLIYAAQGQVKTVPVLGKFKIIKQ